MVNEQASLKISLLLYLKPLEIIKKTKLVKFNK
jgi:hypothetical protein